MPIIQFCMYMLISDKRALNVIRFNLTIVGSISRYATSNKNNFSTTIYYDSLVP